MRAVLLLVAACVLPLACSEVEDSLESAPPGPRRAVSKNEPVPSDASIEAEASIEDAAIDVPVIVDSSPPPQDAGDAG